MKIILSHKGCSVIYYPIIIFISLPVGITDVVENPTHVWKIP